MFAWGKIIGFIIGLILATRIGLIGLLFGLYLGTVFDNALRKFIKQYNKKQNKHHMSDDFIQSTFSLLGYIAKIDGPVNKKTIDCIEQIMQREQLSTQQKKAAINAFNFGKSQSFHLEQTLNQLRYHFLFNPEDKEPLLHMVKQVATSKTPLSIQKVHVINQIYARFGQNVFTEGQFHWQHWNHRQYHDQYRGQYQNQTQEQHDINWAYNLLNVSKKDSIESITKQFRKLRSKFHPDRLQSKATDSEIKKAHEKTIDLQKAYELIKKHHK